MHARLLRWRAVLPWQILTLISGYALYFSFPPHTQWYLAPLAFVGITAVLRHRATRIRHGLGYGLLFGLAFFVPLLPWIGVYVGAVPWLALSVVCALYAAAFGAIATLVSRLPFAPIWLAGVWTLTEWARSNFPFGGFPWGAIAFGQPQGPFRDFARIGGAPLVSFAVVVTGAAIYCAFRSRHNIAVLVVALLCLLGVTQTSPPRADRTITVAAIQGSVPQLGLDFNSRVRAVLDNHVNETLKLADDIHSGKVAQPDVVVWPENASDVDPLRSSTAAAEITRASVAVGAPILVGAVLLSPHATEDDPATTNSVIVWDGTNGPRNQHDKRYIQPFGEYLPWRGFFRLFSSYADKAGYFIPGHDDGVVTADNIPFGVATCYEVAFDGAFRRSVDSGAQILAVPTNNATFGKTDMTYQQLAMSQIRAVEHGRAVTVAATSGVSAIIGPDGDISQQTPMISADYLVAQLPITTGHTIATRWEVWVQVVLCLIGAGTPIFALARRVRHNGLSASRHPADK